MKLILTILLLSLSVVAQNKQVTAERVEQTDKRLAPVRAYVKAVMYYVNTTEFPEEIFADVSDYNTAKKPEWKRFDSQRAFEEANVESYETYFIWKIFGKVSQVNVTYSSPSGDWVQYVFHTFYPSGKAAKIDRELRTFMGDIIVNRVSFFDRNGKLIKESVSYRDLATQKPVKRPESFMDIGADFYLNSNELPFIVRGDS